MTVIKVYSNHYIVRPNKWPSGIALDFQSIYEMVMCSSPAMGDNFHTCIFYCLLFSIFSSLINKQQQSLCEHVYEINCYFSCFENDNFLVKYCCYCYFFLFLFNFCNCGHSLE